MSGMSIGYTQPKANVQFAGNRANILLRIAVKEGIINPSNYDGGTAMFRTPDEMQDYYAKLDANIAERTTAQAAKPLCRARCSECCSFTFGVTASEFGVIREFLFKSDANIAALHKKAVKQLERYKLNCPEDYERFASGSDEDTLDELDALRFEPCLFLDNRKCSIYTARPIVCRLFGVVYGRNLNPQCRKIVQYYLKPRLQKRELIELRNRIMIFLPQAEEMSEGIHYVPKRNLTSRPPFWEPEARYARALPLFWRVAEELADARSSDGERT